MGPSRLRLALSAHASLHGARVCVRVARQRGAGGGGGREQGGSLIRSGSEQ